MSEEMLVKYCSPTLIGMKTANMFSYRFRDTKDEQSNLRKLNRELSVKGLRIIPLRRQNGKTLLYLYRPEKLKKDLRDDAAGRLLQGRGYQTESISRCLAELMKRLRESECFPHEIGLFLGYPPEDVCGFIENNAENCKTVGCWKVYGDVKKVQLTFNKYKRCTEVCCSLYSKGCSVKRMAASY